MLVREELLNRGGHDGNEDSEKEHQEDDEEGGEEAREEGEEVMNQLYGFEWALEQLRQGKKVARQGWNGKGMYLVVQKGYPQGIPINENTADATGMARGTVCTFSPYIMLKTASATPTAAPNFAPWCPTNTDLLETDWTYGE